MCQVSVVSRVFDNVWTGALRFFKLALLRLNIAASEFIIEAVLANRRLNFLKLVDGFLL